MKTVILFAIFALGLFPAITNAENPNELWESYYVQVPFGVPPLGPGQGYLAREPDLCQFYSVGGNMPLDLCYEVMPPALTFFGTAASARLI